MAANVSNLTSDQDALRHHCRALTLWRNKEKSRNNILSINATLHQICNFYSLWAYYMEWEALKHKFPFENIEPSFPITQFPMCYACHVLMPSVPNLFSRHHAISHHFCFSSHLSSIRFPSSTILPLPCLPR